MSNFTIVSFIAILLVLNCSLNSLADDEQLGDGFGNFQDTDINNDGVVNENENNDVFWLNPSDYSITNGTGNFTDDFTNSNESIEQGTTVPTTPFYGDESTVQVPTVSSTTVLNDSVSTTQAPASITTIASTTSVPITTTTSSSSSSSSSSSVEDDRVNSTMSTTIMPISVIPTKLSNALYPSRLFSANLTTSGTHSSTVSTKTYAIQTDYPSSTTVLPTTNQDSIAKSNSSASIPVVPVLSPSHVLSESRINPVNISVTTANTNVTKLNNTNSTDSKISTNSLMHRNITIETDPANSSHSIVSTLAFLLISFILSSLFM